MDVLNVPLTKQQVYLLLEAVVTRKVEQRSKSGWIDELSSVQDALSSAIREQSLGIKLDELDDEIY
tara:strand:+ start:259 stop:456 length:198 start_codon:yes stop_codon:yes gene_type:complete